MYEVDPIVTDPEVDPIVTDPIVTPTLYLGRKEGRLTLRTLADCAGLRSAAAVNLAVKRYERLLQTDRLEAQRAQDCARLLTPRQLEAELLNVWLTPL